MIIHLILIVLISLLVRLPFLRIGNSDSQAYQWMIVNDRTEGIFRALNYGVCVFPILTIKIFAVDGKVNMNALRFMTLLYDVILSVFAYLLIKYLDLSYSTSLLSPELLGALIVATSPILFPHSARLMTVGARTFTTLISTFYVFLLCLLWLGMSEFLYLLFIPIVYVAIQSSLFMLQAIVLTTLLLSGILGWFGPLIALVLSALGLFLIDRKSKELISYFIVSKWIWYSKNQVNNGLTKRNRIKTVLNIPIYLIKDRRKAFEVFFSKNGILISLFSFPHLYVALYILFFSNEIILIEEWIRFLKYYILCVSIIFFLISFRPFLFLGQSERYLEALVIPLTLVFFVISEQFASQIKFDLGLCLLAYNTVMVFVSIYYHSLFGVRNDKIKRQSKGVSDYLNDTAGPKSILTIPTKLAYSFSVATNDNCKFYYSWVSQKPFDGFKRMNNELVTTENPIDDIEYFKANYKVDTLIIRKSFVSRYQSLDSIEKQLGYENEEFLLYKI